MAVISAVPDIVLDHVAVAVERQADAWPRYARDLPSSWIGGGSTAGFTSSQVEYANGMKVEVLEPFAVDQNDFLRRFLDRNGQGPHHLTYKVKDLAGALEIVEAAGYRPVGVDLSSPWWKEAFLHPKDAPGIVVQLAQAAEGGDWGNEDDPSWFPAPRVGEAAALLHVAHAVADIDDARRLFEGLLAGKVADEGDADGVRVVDLVWDGGGCVRLLAGAPLDEWLGGRAGRVHHLAFTTVDPGGVPSATGRSDTVHEIEPDDNLGVRLLLSATPEPFRHHPLGYGSVHG
ncbi:MAG TPA: VOC family protein [Acidimicrobiales bacterium]